MQQSWCYEEKYCWLDAVNEWALQLRFLDICLLVYNMLQQHFYSDEVHGLYKAEEIADKQ